MASKIKLYLNFWSRNIYLTIILEFYSLKINLECKKITSYFFNTFKNFKPHFMTLKFLNSKINSEFVITKLGYSYNFINWEQRLWFHHTGCSLWGGQPVDIRKYIVRAHYHEVIYWFYKVILKLKLDLQLLHRGLSDDIKWLTWNIDFRWT